METLLQQVTRERNEALSTLDALLEAFRDHDDLLDGFLDTHDATTAERTRSMRNYRAFSKALQARLRLKV